MINYTEMEAEERPDPLAVVFPKVIRLKIMLMMIM